MQLVLTILDLLILWLKCVLRSWLIFLSTPQQQECDCCPDCDGSNCCTDPNSCFAACAERELLLIYEGELDAETSELAKPVNVCSVPVVGFSVGEDTTEMVKLSTLGEATPVDKVVRVAVDWSFFDVLLEVVTVVLGVVSVVEAPLCPFTVETLRLRII